MDELRSQSGGIPWNTDTEGELRQGLAAFVDAWWGLDRRCSLGRRRRRRFDRRGLSGCRRGLGARLELAGREGTDAFVDLGLCVVGLVARDIVASFFRFEDRAAVGTSALARGIEDQDGICFRVVDDGRAVGAAIAEYQALRIVDAVLHHLVDQ